MTTMSRIDKLNDMQFHQMIMQYFIKFREFVDKIFSVTEWYMEITVNSGPHSNTNPNHNQRLTL